MQRRELLMALSAYRSTWVAGRFLYRTYSLNEEQDTFDRLLDFVRREPNCLRRDCPEGHITASALLTNPEMDKVLLTLHAKLGKWLQLGGHVEGEHDVALAAEREAREESGIDALAHFQFTAPFDLQDRLPFDCDIHEIPARASEPAHLHYDIRFLLIADHSTPLQLSQESKDLRWLPLAEARQLTNERSMQRQFDKLEFLRSSRFGL